MRPRAKGEQQPLGLNWFEQFQQRCSIAAGSSVIMPASSARMDGVRAVRMFAARTSTVRRAARAAAAVAEARRVGEFAPRGRHAGGDGVDPGPDGGGRRRRADTDRVELAAPNPGPPCGIESAT
jgi:hypothetical protein